MRKVSANTFISLDGVMQAPGGPDEDPTGGFAYGGWSTTFWDETMVKIMDAAMAQPFDLLLGRKTYEVFAAHWPAAEGPAADVLNNARKYVATRTLDHATWANTTLITGDVVEAVTALKAQDGPELQVQGSSELMQTLLSHDLVDELRVWTFPILLGTGKRLFGDGTVPASLSVRDAATSTSGVLITTYERVGAEIPMGSFALPEPTDAELERRAHLSD